MTFNIFHQLKPQLCQDEIVSPSAAVNATYMVDQPLNGGSPDCGCTSLAYIMVWLSSFELFQLLVIFNCALKYTGVMV